MPRVEQHAPVGGPAILHGASDDAVAELRAAIATGQLVLYYQPKIDLTTGSCTGAEALVRWRHPERGLVFPDEFIPLAEKSGLIAELTTWVAEEAIRQCRAWQAGGLYITVAVNISAESLRDHTLFETFRAALDEHAVSPFSLEIEVTETGVMDDPAAALALLERFNDVGIHTAVDDFGTGFSSLLYLRDLPVHTLKIDKSFVMSITSNDRNEAIVASTVALGHALGLRVVAEGVEDAASAATLQELGCDVGQGYFWSRPLPPDALVEWLARSHGTPPRAGGWRAPQRRKVELALEATRRLFTCTTRAALTQELVAAVVSIGGTIVSADEDHDGHALQLDLSLGQPQALLASAAPGSLARQHLDEFLPLLVTAAQLVAANGAH